MRQRLQHWLHGVWYDGAPGGFLLAPLGWLYAAVVAVRRMCFQKRWLSCYRASIPVIVVGNITVGGVGKTPLVGWLVDSLKQRGYSPGVVTRGYGGSLEGPVQVTRFHRADETGDEALMLFERLDNVPVMVGRRRADSVAALESMKVDVVVADDGLQHYALARDIEICVIDEQRQFGNGRSLPAGPLREPVSRLDTVDIVVYHRPALHQGQAGMTLGNPVLRRLSDDAILPLKTFHGQTVHAIAGIGNPQRFFDSLERAGLQIVSHPFPDHHRFTPDDLAFHDELPVLMTDKDAVKCQEFAGANCYSVRVEAVVSDDVKAHIMGHLAELEATKQTGERSYEP